MLLIEGQDGDQLWLLGVSENEGELIQVGESYSFEPVTFEAALGMVSNAAAHDGAGSFVTVEKNGDRNVLMCRQLASQTPVQTIELGDLRPVALHLVSRGLYVGTWGEVGWFDLDADPIVYQRLVHRPDFTHKPYDLFARNGDWLLAIDDNLMPILADLFRLDEEGRPTHFTEWKLPGLVNGTYRHALLVRNEEDAGVLYASGPYERGYKEPGGQLLFALPIERESLGREESWLSEIRPGTGEGDSPTLVAGDAFTQFGGMAWLPAKNGREANLFVAAGERGILVLPHMLAEDPAPKLIDAGGPVADVMTFGDALHALVGGERSRVVRLDAQDGSFVPGASFDLPGPARRFVR
ncbi:MAG: hypothetical protein ACOCVR_01790 [Myxococcota bacterium]